jgi:hypothetical protein
MGFLDILTKPINPARQGFDEYDIFLAERNVRDASYKDWYDYDAAYEHYRETGIDPYDSKSKHWTSKFKHPLSPERYIQDKESKKWFDTIKNKFVNKEAVAQQEIERLEYLESMPLNGNKKR